MTSKQPHLEVCVFWTNDDGYLVESLMYIYMVQHFLLVLE